MRVAYQGPRLQVGQILVPPVDIVGWRWPKLLATETSFLEITLRWSLVGVRTTNTTPHLVVKPLSFSSHPIWTAFIPRIAIFAANVVIHLVFVLLAQTVWPVTRDHLRKQGYIVSQSYSLGVKGAVRLGDCESSGRRLAGFACRDRVLSWLLSQLPAALGLVSRRGGPEASAPTCHLSETCQAT